MPDNDESVYRDLASFLSSDRPDLRAKAAEAAAAVAASDSSADGPKSEPSGSGLVRAGAVPPLCRLTSQPGPTGLDALTALLRLSSGGPGAAQCVEDMVDAGASSRLTEIALCSPPPAKAEAASEAWRRRTNLSLALLANLTRTERGAVEFCGRSMPDEAVSAATKGGAEGEGGEGKVRREAKPSVTLLLGRYLLPMLIHETEDSWKGTAEEIGGRSDDPFQHFASVLMNATQVEQGRRFVLRLASKPSASSVLQSLLPSLRHPNPVRRRGVAGTLKNCAFDADSAWWLLNEVDLTRHLLYPLAGPEELYPDDRIGLDPDLWLEGPDKVREPDRDVRLLLVECILLLCASGRKSRETLRAKRTYVILKMMDMVEEDEDVSARVNDCVQYLRRDEEGTQEGSSDRKAEEACRGGATAAGRKGLPALPAPSSSERVQMKSADFDDVD